MKSLGFDDHPDIASSIGFAYAKLGNPGEARSWYNRALAADPNHISTLVYSGALYVAQGDLAKDAAATSSASRRFVALPLAPNPRDSKGQIAAKGR